MTEVTPHANYDRFRRIASKELSTCGGWSGIAYRSARPRYAKRKDLLTGAGSKRYGGRWNPPVSFAAVYVSLSWGVASAEAVAHQRHFGVPEHAALPRTFVGVDLDLARVLDLCDGRLRQRLGVSRKRMLAEDWRSVNDGGEEAVTQALGRAAYEVGFQGILAPSAAERTGTNIVVFPDRLGSDGTIKPVDREDDP